jgi:hypothetical protein
MTYDEAMALVAEGRAVTSASLPNGAVVKLLPPAGWLEGQGEAPHIFYPLTGVKLLFDADERDEAATWHEVEGWN